MTNRDAGGGGGNETDGERKKDVTVNMHCRAWQVLETVHMCVCTGSFAHCSISRKLAVINVTIYSTCY
jgi:hypothetical protein